MSNKKNPTKIGRFREQTKDVPVTAFRGRRLPSPAQLAGYSALIDRYALSVPLHHEMAAVSPKTRRHREGGWKVLPSSLRPGDSDVEQLVFALKYEGIHLLTLKKVFEVFEPAELVEAALAKPTSGYLRRLCHLYEWLLDRRLNAPDVSTGAYVNLIDSTQQYCTPSGLKVRRFRVSHNLPGTRAFCPVVFKTHRIDAFIASDLARKARDVVDSAPRELIARAAAFLLLSDSKASFAIEGENPPRDRLMRWGSAIGRAGDWRLDREAPVDLQRSLIGDDRFVTLGFRNEGGFVGRHDAMTQPVPEHISARAEDLTELIDGLVAFANDARTMGYHAVLTAACIAFGFVYIHPFEDGNGRIHRFLMHHVLADRGFTPVEIVFPISSVILDDVVGYKTVLESVAAPLLEWIAWAPTPKGNLEVLNDTVDFYRYFDATAHCEFLFKCIERSVEKDLPEELGFLEHRDAFHRAINTIVDMGERKIDLLLDFLRQGHGALSQRARTQEFAALREDEVQRIQSIYEKLFKPSDPVKSHCAGTGDLIPGRRLSLMPGADAPSIRRLSPEDVALFRRLNALFAVAFDDPQTYQAAPPDDVYVERLLGTAHVFALVAIADEEVVGGLVAYELEKFERARGEIYIYDLAVAASHRRKGIATALIAHLREIAAARGAWAIFVQADYGDDPAVALYTKLGTRGNVMHFDIAMGDGDISPPS